eukprot:gene44046-58736_t
MAQTEHDPGADAPMTPSEPPAVPLGAAMPDIAQVPTLLPDAAAATSAPTDGSARHTRLAQGLSFVGSAVVDGPITLAGEMRGNLRVAEPGEGLFTVAESGQLVGDARALNISVLGRTEGLLDKYTTLFRQQVLSGSREITDRFKVDFLAGVSNSDLDEPMRATVQFDTPNVNGFSFDFRNNRNGDRFKTSDDLLSPRLGVIYKPVEQVSLYANYSIAYQPRAGDQLASLTLSNAALEPEKFKNYEIGAKWDVSHSLAATA